MTYKHHIPKHVVWSLDFVRSKLWNAVFGDSWSSYILLALILREASAVTEGASVACEARDGRVAVRSHRVWSSQVR